jgi:cytochrome b561
VRYSYTSIALHWSIALLIGTNLILGWTFRNFEPPVRHSMVAVHESIGLTILGLTIIRIIWRLSHPPPSLPSRLPGIERVLAAAVQFAFYALMITVPLFGWLVASSWSPPRPVYLWGMPFPFFPFFSAAAREGLRNTAATVHARLALMFVFLMLLHVSGALKHHLYDGHSVFFRMIPVRTFDLSKP